MDKISFNLDRYKQKKLAATYWQDCAAKACKGLKVPDKHKSAIFKAFRLDVQKAIQAYRSMVGKKLREPWTYFLKLV